jgi:hypothetical protein
MEAVIRVGLAGWPGLAGDACFPQSGRSQGTCADCETIDADKQDLAHAERANVEAPIERGEESRHGDGTGSRQGFFQGVGWEMSLPCSHQLHCVFADLAAERHSSAKVGRTVRWAKLPPTSGHERRSFDVKCDKDAGMPWPSKHAEFAEISWGVTRDRNVAMPRLSVSARAEVLRSVGDRRCKLRVVLVQCDLEAIRVNIQPHRDEVFARKFAEISASVRSGTGGTRNSTAGLIEQNVINHDI